MNEVLKDKIAEIKFAGKNICGFISVEDFVSESVLLDKIAAFVSKERAVLILDGKSLSDNLVISLGQKIKVLCAEYNSLLIICHRADLGVLLNADGIIFADYDIPLHSARHIAGENVLIGTFDYAKNSEEVDFYIDENFLHSKFLAKSIPVNIVR